MHLNALLDVDVVAVETADRLTLLVELAAPAPARPAARPPATLQLVLDRSGSMGGGQLEAAKRALRTIVDRLDPSDHFGLVVFDDAVSVAVPAGPLASKAAVRHVIGALDVGGSTNLGGGLVRGVQEARRVKGERGATVVLVSDGHANVGVVDPARLAQAAAAARAVGVTVATVGMGLGYDEQLLAAIARGGAGNTHFAEEADAAGEAIAAEVDGLLEQVATAATLTVRPTGAVAGIELWNDLPANALAEGIVVELGDFYAGEERRLLLAFDVPAMPGLGLAQVCELALSWVEVATLDTHTVTIPLHVNVLPGDQAAGRVANATVQTEVAFQAAQRAKREAADALRRGDTAAATRAYGKASRAIGDAAAAAPPPLAAELRGEAALMLDLADRASWDDANRLAKFTEADRHRKNRRRGRPGRP
jgi:Ca-activated chloride channel homolog